MRRLATVLYLAMLFGSITTPLVAIEVGVRFTGTVLQVPPTAPFGMNVASGASVEGHFIYDVDSPATHSFPECDDCGYRQQITNGFTISFRQAENAIAVRADDYVVAMFDNVDDAIFGMTDAIAVRFDGGLIPQSHQSLMIDKSNEMGVLNVSFSGSPTAFDGTQLQASPQFEQLFSRTGVLSDSGELGEPEEILGLVFLIDAVVPLAIVPGDYNWDGMVDTMDYRVWRESFGSQCELEADGNRDGVVGIADYVRWRNSLGRIAEPFRGATSQVPEPRTTTLTILLIVSIGLSPASLAKTADTRLSNESGFTVVELLAVLAVLGILFAILLPALGSVRGTARRTACQNNLRMLGTGVLNFDAVHQELPIGAAGGVYRTHGVSWFSRLLPFLELSSLADDIELTGVQSGSILLHANNGNAIDGVQVDGLFCPSAAWSPLEVVGQFHVMMPSYVGIAGAVPDEEFDEGRVNQCCIPKLDGHIGSGGVLTINRAIRSRSITDGLSNTLLASEISDYSYGTDGLDYRTDAGYKRSWLMGTPGVGTPPDYHSRFPAWNITTIGHPINHRIYHTFGVYSDNGPNNPLISPHPRGVNMLLADGAVVFADENMTMLVLKRMSTRDDGSGYAAIYSK